jgi:hypothetical protein
MVAGGGYVNDLEHLTVQLFARFGLEELAKPVRQHLDRDDVFSDAYSRAMELLPGSVGFVDDIRDSSELVHALYVALLAELSRDEKLRDEELRTKARGLLMSYFVPEDVGIVTLELMDRSAGTAKEDPDERSG